MQPRQTPPAARLATNITTTASAPARAVSRTAGRVVPAGLPRAARDSPASESAKATALQTRPQPATGSPVVRWISEANAPFQTAEQSSLPPAAQKELPPERSRTSSIQRKSD